MIHRVSLMPSSLLEFHVSLHYSPRAYNLLASQDDALRRQSQDARLPELHVLSLTAFPDITFLGSPLPSELDPVSKREKGSS